MKLKLRWIIFFITLTYLLFQFVIPWRIKEPNYDIHEPSAKSFAKYVFETIIPSIEPELKFIEINESPLPEVLADQPGFTTNPKIIRKRESVTLTWSHAGGASASLFCPPSSPSPLLSRGVGDTAVFDVLNTRSPCVIRGYSQNGAAESHLQVVTDYPNQGHLSLTEDLTQMRISWVSSSSNAPQVVYGVASDRYQWIQSDLAIDLFLRIPQGINRKKEIHCIDRSDLVKAIFWMDPGNLHTAVMTDLKPNTRYYYRYGYQGRWSEESSFVSAPVGTPMGGVHILLTADQGKSDCMEQPGWCEPSAAPVFKQMTDEVTNKRYDMVLNVGDISCTQYSMCNSALDAIGYGNKWEQFMYQIEPIAVKVPYMVGIGNHEYDWVGQPFRPVWGNFEDPSGSYGECGIPYVKRFPMPSNGNKANWYYIDYPLVFIIVISTEHDFTAGSEQYKWLQATLAKVNHEEKWLIVTGHRPMYSSMFWTDKELTVNNHVRLELEPLFVKYGVDLGFWGHMHCYERTCPVENGVCKGTPEKPGGPMHFVVGTGGRDLFYNWLKPHPGWSAARVTEYGYVEYVVNDFSLLIHEKKLPMAISFRGSIMKIVYGCSIAANNRDTIVVKFVRAPGENVMEQVVVKRNDWWKTETQT